MLIFHHCLVVMWPTLRGEQIVHEFTVGSQGPDSIITILYDFPCEMDFFQHESPNPTRVTCDEGRNRRQVVRNPSHMEYHIKCILSYTLHFKASCTNWSWRSWKACEMDLSHNCSLHGESQKYSKKQNWYNHWIEGYMYVLYYSRQPGSALHNT